MDASRGEGSLLGNGRFVRLWVGQSVSFIGDAVSLVALVVIVADLSGSAANVGWVLGARLLPTLFSPLVGVLADRIRDRRRLLVAVDVARAALVLLIVFAGNLYALYALVFLLGVCQTFFNPTIRSAFPGVVGGGDLTRANALISGSFSFSVAAGPALGGLLVVLVGARSAFVVDALTFLLSAALLVFVPMPAQRAEEEEEAGFFEDFRAGMGYLARTRLPLAIVVGAFLVFLTENVIVPAEVFLARDVFGAGDAGYGLLVGVWGGGMVAGSALMALLGDRANLLAAYFVSIFLSAVALCATGAAPLFVLALAALAVAGLCNGLDNVATDAILQKRVPGEFLGRVYSVMFLGTSGGQVLALAAGGFIVDAAGPRGTYLISSAALATAGLLVFVLAATAPRTKRSTDLAA